MSYSYGKEKEVNCKRRASLFSGESMETMTKSAAKKAKADLSLTLSCLIRAQQELPGFTKESHHNDIMDLDSLNHCADIAMDWQKLLDAPAFDFAHDMYGIRRHMDRSQWPGKLKDCFLPRCAR